MIAAEPTKPLWKKLALPIGVGAVSGFLASFAFLRLADIGDEVTGSASHEIAGLVGVLYILTGLVVILGVLRPGAGAKILNVEDADELREQRIQLTYSSLGMGALGGALLSLALSGPGLPLDPVTGPVLAALLILIGVALSLAMVRYTDELQRSLSRDAVGTAFYLLFLVGGGWAILAHAAVVEAATPLDWLTMFAVTLLLGAFWQVARRGLLTRGPN